MANETKINYLKSYEICIYYYYDSNIGCSANESSKNRKIIIIKCVMPINLYYTI